MICDKLGEGRQAGIFWHNACLYLLHIGPTLDVFSILMGKHLCVGQNLMINFGSILKHDPASM